MVIALRFVRHFSARTDNERSVVVDGFVVSPDYSGFRERCAVARNICGLCPNKADWIVDRARFVIRDLEEEGGDGLSKSCKVGFGRFSDNRLEVVEGVGEFRHDLLGHHSAPKIARPSS